MNIEEIRMKFWCDVYLFTGTSNHQSEEYANEALNAFDKRFLAQVGIKETGDLGIILDTERPWIKVEDQSPQVEEDVEVMFTDNTTDLGWMGERANWFAKQGDFVNKSYYWNPSSKTVIAWRELPIKTEE